jgi:HEAT repeat protein
MKVHSAVGVIAILGLCALPAHGGDPPTTPEIHTLTPIDTLPTRDEILNLHPDPVPRLRELALDEQQNADFGVRLRAIRALPQFCNSVPSCQGDTDANMHPSRAAIREVISSVSPSDRDGRTILRLRAGIESLGSVKSAKQSDVDLLIPFLGHSSRDVRAATARALRDICLPTAEAPLRNRYDEEAVTQVRLAISAALGDLAVCSP